MSTPFDFSGKFMALGGTASPQGAVSVTPTQRKYKVLWFCADFQNIPDAQRPHSEVVLTKDANGQWVGPISIVNPDGTVNLSGTFEGHATGSKGISGNVKWANGSDGDFGATGTGSASTKLPA